MRIASLALARGLASVPDLAALVTESDLLVSTCPPEAAVEVSRAVCGLLPASLRGVTYLDLTSISPATAHTIGRSVAASGQDFVDGSISRSEQRTTLYLAGARVAELSAALRVEGVATRALSEEPGRASALKMCTSAVNKSTTLLWGEALRAAERLGLLEAVLEDLSASFPGIATAIEHRIAVGAAKSARYVFEMEEIARTWEELGLSGQLFLDLAQTCSQWTDSPLGNLSPEQAYRVARLMVGGSNLVTLGDLLSMLDPP